MPTHYDFDRIIERRDTQSAKWSHPSLLPLWVADMDFESPPQVAEAIQRRAQHNIYGYDRIPKDYFKVVQSWFSRRQNFKVEKDWLVITSGVVEALFLAIHAFTLPGDAVVIQPPVYHPFARSVLRSGRQLVNNPLKRVEGGYELDLEDLEAKLSQPLVKLLILCNPHNPIGKVYTPEELTAVGQLALKHGVLVISDEIHSDLMLDGNRHTPFASISQEFAQNSLTCTAPSKTFNLAGLATSNIFIPNPKLRDQFTRFTESLGIKGGSLYGLIAAEAAYRDADEWLDQLLSYLGSNAAYFRNYLEENIPLITADRLQGTYLQWVDFRKLGLNDEELEAFLRDKAKLWLSQGHTFGREGSGFIRFNLATPRANLTQALEQLTEAVHTLNRGS